MPCICHPFYIYYVIESSNDSYGMGITIIMLILYMKRSRHQEVGNFPELTQEGWGEVLIIILHYFLEVAGLTFLNDHPAALFHAWR